MACKQAPYGLPVFSLGHSLSAEGSARPAGWAQSARPVGAGLALPGLWPGETEYEGVDKLGRGSRRHESIFSAFINASCGISTFPNWRIFFLPAFCFSRSFFFRVTSPP